MKNPLKHWSGNNMWMSSQDMKILLNKAKEYITNLENENLELLKQLEDYNIEESILNEHSH